jgi:hypothetical protein
VVWKQLYLSPPAANRSAVGLLMGPLKALEAANPSRSRMIKTLDAPFGGRSGSIGGNLVSGSLASYAVRPTYSRSGNVALMFVR